MRNIILRESRAEYEDKAREYLTSHQLADYRRCPLLYRKKQLGLVKSEERPAYLVGRALHTFVLEGFKQFEKEYAIGGPINPRTGDFYGPNTKASSKWAAEHKKDILTLEQSELINCMADSVRKHKLAADLLSEGIPEGVVRTTYCSLPCQIRMDWFNPNAGIVELKTCDDLDWFVADVRRYQYIFQVAFYQGVFARATSRFEQVYFIAVEKKEPYRCGIWHIHKSALTAAREENEIAMRRLQESILNDQWPTYYEERRILDEI